MGLEHLNYDQWLEQPYQDKENEGMEYRYKLNILETEYTIYDLIDMLSPTEQVELHQLIIDHFTETLLNAME